jgi:hypothetical protein
MVSLIQGFWTYRIEDHNAVRRIFKEHVIGLRLAQCLFGPDTLGDVEYDREEYFAAFNLNKLQMDFNR